MKKFAVILTTAMITAGTIFGSLMPVSASIAGTVSSSPIQADAITSATVKDNFYEEAISGYVCDDEDSSVSDGSAYTGSYVCGRASIEITKTGNTFDVTIDWGCSAYEMAEWNYSCGFDNASGSLIADGSGTKTMISYDENGNESLTEVYSGASAEFSLVGDSLIWEDHAENAGYQMIFEHIS